MKVAVVGLGYVGLPLAIRLSQLNFDVLAIDIYSEKIEKLQNGILPFAQNEPYLNGYFQKEYERDKISFSTTFEEIIENDLVFICVDTPIIGKTPDYHSLKKSLKHETDPLQAPARPGYRRHRRVCAGSPKNLPQVRIEPPPAFQNTSFRIYRQSNPQEASRLQRLYPYQRPHPLRRRNRKYRHRPVFRSA